MSKQMDKAIKDLKAVNKSQTSPIAKAMNALVSAAQTLAKGSVDLDAKDYESSDYDENDTRPRRRPPRQVEDRGNGYSGMEPTPVEENDFHDGDNAHRVIVTGKESVNGGSPNEEDWEDPEEPNVGDPEWYSHTRGKNSRSGDKRDPFYRSENEDHEEDEMDEEDRHEKRMKNMHKKSNYAEDEDEPINKSEQEIYEELLKSQDFAEIVESSAVVELMANTMAKGFGAQDDKIEDISARLNDLSKGLLAVMGALHEISKSFENMPATSPALGVIGRIGEQPVTLSTDGKGLQKGNLISADASSKEWYRNTMVAIEHGVAAGDIRSDALVKFDVNAQEVIKSIPEDVRTKYGITLRA